MSGPDKGIFGLAGAPPRNLPFPNANITAVELLTFLPNCVTSTDVVYRFASNQTTCDAILSIVNTNRILERVWVSDYYYRTTRNAMRHAGYGGWTLKKHPQIFSQALGSWDATKLSVGGFRTSFEVSGEGKLDADIPFARLADGVKNMPKGNDALDLTRMVQHCVQHPDEGWMYPSNYNMLLQRLGGPKQPSAANMDRAIFSRWEHVLPRVPRSRRPVEPTPQPGMWIPGQLSMLQHEEQAPRRSGRQKRPSVKKLEFLEEDLSEAENSGAEEDDEEYVRGPTRWEKPPRTKGVISVQALEYIFDTQSIPGTDSKFDAYAFGDGPRAIPPFRPLHLITGLKFDDLSGWAENLRWEAEQNATFGEIGWTESPEHMERIAQIRQEQTWASAELVIAMTDSQEQDEEDEGWVQTMTDGIIASMDWNEPDLRLSVLGNRIGERVDAEGKSRFVAHPWPGR